MMKLRRWGFPVLLLVAGLALWLLLAGPSQLLGLDTGKAGMALLVTAAWVLLFAAQSLPRGDLDRAASPGEWKAWIGVVFMAVAVMAALRQSLSAVLEQTAVPVPLQERRYGIRVAAPGDRSLFTTAVFVLAVRADMPAEALRRNFPNQVKIGPVEQIRELVKVALPGIGARPLPVAPRQRWEGHTSELTS